MAGIRTCDHESQVQRPDHYTTVLIFIILHQKCKNSVILSLTLILTLISRADW